MDLPLGKGSYNQTREALRDYTIKSANTLKCHHLIPSFEFLNEVDFLNAQDISIRLSEPHQIDKKTMSMELIQNNGCRLPEYTDVLN